MLVVDDAGVEVFCHLKLLVADVSMGDVVELIFDDEAPVDICEVQVTQLEVKGNRRFALAGTDALLRAGGGGGGGGGGTREGCADTAAAAGIEAALGGRCTGGGRAGAAEDEVGAGGKTDCLTDALGSAETPAPIAEERIGPLEFSCVDAEGGKADEVLTGTEFEIATL